MRIKSILFLFLLLLAHTVTAAAEDSPFFPCVLDYSYDPSAYSEYVEIDLRRWHRMEIDNWEDDNLMVQAGSAIVLNRSALILDLHFSDSFDYEANDTHLPEELTFFNLNPDVSNDTGTPEWQVTIFPDSNDPYAFHYFGTYNWTMAGIYICGSYTNSEGESNSCFDLHIAVY